MRKIKFESDNGYSIEFTENPEAQYILEQFDGNGLAGEPSAIKQPGRDGKKTYGLTRSHRGIQIDCAIISKGGSGRLMKQAQSENRDYAARAFDPGYFGTLYYYAYRGDRGKRIRCKPTGLPAFEPDFNNLTKFKLALDSDGALWEKADAMIAALGLKRSRWRFPHAPFAPASFALIDARAVMTNATLYNIDPVVTVYNSELPVHVANINTGAYLRFKVPTGKNRRLVADIREASAVLEENIDGAWVYKENVIHYLELDSRLIDFIIAPGKNEFKLIGMEGQTEQAILIISAHEPVMGV